MFVNFDRYKMPDAVLPHDCISIDTLRLTKRPTQRKADVEEFFVHSMFTEPPSRLTRYSLFPFEFALDEMVMSRPPVDKGSKKVASFATRLDSTQYQFMQKLDKHLQDLLSSKLSNDDKFNWTPLMTDDGNINVHLPFNSWGQPSLPSFRRGTKERASIFHIKQGHTMRVVISIGYMYCIHPDEIKNRTGFFQCGAMTTVKYIEIDESTPI